MNGPRVAPLSDAELAALPPSLRARYEALDLLGETRPLNAFRTFARHQPLAEAWFGLVEALLKHGTLPARDRERWCSCASRRGGAARPSGASTC